MKLGYFPKPPEIHISHILPKPRIAYQALSTHTIYDPQGRWISEWKKSKTSWSNFTWVFHNYNSYTISREYRMVWWEIDTQCCYLLVIITWLCDILALVWHFGPACVTFRPGLCDILALSCVTKASACHHTSILTTGAVYGKFHPSSVSKTT